MTAAETEGMRTIETAIHHLVRRLLKAIDHHEGYRLYAAEFINPKRKFFVPQTRMQRLSLAASLW